MKLSVVLAAHNEEENIAKLIPGLIKSYNKHILEILVVNDASADKTEEVARKLMKKHSKIKLINRQPPCGVGRALKDGFRNVSEKADWVLTMDSDFIHNVPDLQRFIEKTKEGYDLVIGSRYMPEGKLVNYPLLKRITNRMYHILLRNVLGIKCHDLTNNFKLYKAEIVKSIKWKSNDFAINAETGLFPYVKGYKVVEIPVAWIQRSHGKSDFKVLGLAPSYLKVLSRVLFRKV